MTEAETEKISTHAEVELDIFSGVKNPIWILTEPEIESFLERISHLPPASDSQLPGHVGYHGFIVRISQGSIAQSIRVYQGVVETTWDTQKSIRVRYRSCAIDAKRALERWLLDIGKMYLAKDIYKTVLHELDRII